MFFYGVEILINLFEAYLILFFVKNRLHIARTSRFADAACLIACTAFLTLYLFFDITLNSNLLFVFPLVYSLYMASDSWPVIFFWNMILALLFCMVASGGVYLLISLFPSYQNAFLSVGSWAKVLFLIAINVVLFIVIFTASRIEKDHHFITWPVMLTFLLISASLFVAEEFVYAIQMRTGGDPHMFSMAYLAMLACTLLSLFLFHFMAQSSRKENQYKQELSTYQLTQKHQQEFAQMYGDFIQREHDFKHHLETMERLIDRKANQDAHDYLESYRSMMAERRHYMTGCTAVDALLTAKTATMKAHDIPFRFTPYPLHDLPLPSPDFCAIVGNLLDNAIEGVQRIADPSANREISLAFARTYDVFHIVCKNPCAPESLRMKNARWLSSKGDDRGYHGLGIASIERIVDQAEGYCSFRQDGETFIAELTISFPRSA